ncbi:MAG: hypothetical protein M3303_00825, partial [Gemmatimonadota bacterium]|nr:hypothetical protein [Gemmatimonadota bacterium]
TATTAAAESASEPEVSRLGEDGLVTNADAPGNRVRRLLKLVLGISGTAAAILVAVSAFTGPDDDEWPGVGGASAAPAFARSRPIAVATGDVRPVEKNASLPTASAASTPRGRAASPVLKQAGEGLPRATAKREETSTRPRPSAPRTGEQSGATSAAGRAPVPPAAGPPSVILSLPTVGRFELLPSEVLVGLRDRLLHGKEKIEFGEYAAARKIYRLGLEQIASFGDRYQSEALAAVKQELEQAAERALAACSAENDVRRRRNGKAVQCD